MAQIQFEKCTIEKIEALQQLSLTTFVEAFGSQNKPEDMDAYCNSAFSLKKLKEELENEGATFYFVTLGVSKVGYFKLNIETAQTEPIKNGLEIERIYLLSAFQSKGIGQLVFNKIFEIARLMNKTHLWLGVWDKNFGAIHFYERNGFKVFSQHDFMLGQDLQTDVLMELHLDNG